VLVRSWKVIAAVAISSALGLGVAQTQDQQQPQAQQAKPEKNWKDRAEYDLVDKAGKETDPAAKVKLLDEWKAKYPNTDFQAVRLQLYLLSYQAMGNATEVVNAAKQLLALDPKNLPALSAINYFLPSVPRPAADDLAAGEKAANTMISSAEELFAPDKKPQGMNDADWKKARPNAEAVAHRTLGWVSMQRKENEAAEKEFATSLKVNPDQGLVSYWIGTVILAQKKPERQAEALYHFARAAAYDGPDAVPPAGRQQLDKYLTGVYTKYHGDQTGLAELKAQAKTQPFPSEGFKILSSDEVAAHKEEQLSKENPSLAFWLKLKAALEAPEGQQYFDSGMKGALVPPEGAPVLQGKVVSQTGERAAKEVKLAMGDSSTPEVTLQFDPAMPGKVEPGTQLSFRGIPESFTKAPFNVVFKVEKAHLSGWPQAAPPAKAKVPARRPAARKK
jgi:tetratricopeptide (TPR) repeat protein